LTTWENITNVIPMLEDADRIKLVSQPAHGLKARVYLQRQRPDLAAKLAPAADYRPGEWLFLKPILAARGLRSLRAIPATELGSARSCRQRPERKLLSREFTRSRRAWLDG
jgi:uncharacterized SAM-binding protein YcdF (DUF218 family)